MFQIYSNSIGGRALIAVMLVSVFSGCASQSRSTYPVLEQTLSTDDELDCLGLDDGILKANAIRDAIFREHGDVINEAVLGSVLEIAVDPVFGTLQSILAAVRTSKSAKKYIEAAVAAGSRMEQLLEYKERDACPSGPTAIPELTDTDVLNGLRDLELQLEGAEVNGKDYIVARRALLDNLRPLPNSDRDGDTQ